MYKLPGSIKYLFEKELTEIKSVGFNIARAANDHECSYQEFFTNYIHYQFFFYEYERLLPLQNKIKKCSEKIASLTPRAVKTYEQMANRLNGLLEKEEKIYRNAELRFKDIQYCKRKIVSLVFHEMFYESLKLKQIGGKDGEQSYATDLMLNLKRKQIEYNSKMLASKGINIGNKFHSLTNFVASGEKKVAELYANIKGMQDLAEERNYGWAFLTMTAPAKYHANPKKGKNTWNGQSVKEAHNYLKGCWKALGQSLKDEGIYMNNGDIFGMRVVEPHKDGTPHWHMIIFYDNKHKELLFGKNGLYPKHFTNNGRSRKQLDIVIGIIDQVTSEDNKVASAASYCFKYITKAIGTDFLEKTDSVEDELKRKLEKKALERIIAWRTAVSIRAYQPIGLPSSRGKWNALRKISYRAGYAELILNKDEHGKVDRTFRFARDFVNDHDYYLHIKLLEDELMDLSQQPLIEDFYQNINVELERERQGLIENYFQTSSAIKDIIINIDVYSHFSTNFQNLEFNKVLHDRNMSNSGMQKLSPSNDFELSEEYETHFEKEFAMHTVLNSKLNEYQQLYLEKGIKNILKHAVNNDYKEFIKALEETDLDFNDILINELYRDKYGDLKKKLIGVNVGKWVYLFKSHQIVDKPGDPSQAVKYLDALKANTKILASKKVDEDVIEGLNQIIDNKFYGLEKILELSKVRP